MARAELCAAVLRDRADRATVLVSTQGTIEAFRTANIYWHFTNFTVGHSHLAMYGFVAFMIWGAAYGLVPRLTGREPNPLAVGVHFWLALVGAT